MSKKKLFAYKKYYSPTQPGQILDKDPFVFSKEHRSFKEVAEYLESRRYIQNGAGGAITLLPKGVFLQNAILQRCFRIMRQLGALEYRFPSIFSDKDKRIKQGLIEKFKNQLFSINIHNSEKESYYLKYASDPMVFQHFAETSIQVPLRTYSPDYFFRAIKSGELKQLLQPREFFMTDFHFFEEVDNGLSSYFELAKISAKIMNSLVISKNNWTLNIDTNIDFFSKKNLEILKMLDELKVPAVLNVTEKRTHYYSIQNQYVVDYYQDNKTQLANLQYDEQNGSNFSITSKVSGEPVNVIHGTLFGRTEKVMGLIFGERIEKMIAEESYSPTLPIWLTPIIVRIIPASQDTRVLEFSKKILEELLRMQCRSDIDLRTISFNKKIKLAEQEWVPFQLIVGERELNENNFSIRDRFSGSNYVVSSEKFFQSILDLLKSEVENTPQNTPIYLIEE